MDESPGRDSSRDARRLKSYLERASTDRKLALPLLPQVASRVMSEVRETSCTAATLSEIIKRDPALTACLLRTANSAYFAGISEISSLPTAIGRLGSSMVVAVTMGSVSRDVFHSDDPTAHRVLERSWERSVQAAAAAFRLAAAAGMDRESSFTIGLMHAIGEPVLVELYSRGVQEEACEKVTPKVLAEAIDPLASKTGGRLLEEWGLPATIHEAVRHQRAPERAPDGHTDAAAVCGLSALLAARTVEGGDAEQTIEALLATRACALIRVAREFLAEVIESIASDAREYDRAFSSASPEG